jgi:hypothetical protein
MLSFSVSPKTTFRIVLGVIAFGTPVFVITLYTYNFPIWQVLLATILLLVCAYPTLRYLKVRDQMLPVLPLLCLSYALQFAVPVFTHEPMQRAFNNEIHLDDEQILPVLGLCIAGVILLQVAYHLVRSKKVTRLLPAVNIQLTHRRIEIFCILAISLSFLLRGAQTIFFPRDDQQFAFILAFLENQVLVAIGLLGWLVYTKQGRLWHKILLYGTVIAIAGMRGFFTTMLELMLVPVVVLFATKWIYTRRMPVAGLALVSVIIIFLSPVKGRLRTAAILEKDVSSVQEGANAAANWIGQSADYWTGTFMGERSFAESTLEASNRTDMVHQVAYMYMMTPDVQPYYGGSSYSYFLVSLIPRAIWPNKPTATGSSTQFAIEYGIISEEIAKTASFGPTLIGEGYVNFGILGALMVMFLQGAILSLAEQICAMKSPAGMSVFVGLFVFLLNGIGASAAIIFGGIVQSLVAGCALLWLFSLRDSRSLAMGITNLRLRLSLR